MLADNRNIVAQPRSTIDLRRIMDEGRILIVNLAKGPIGEGTPHLLGALLSTALATAALSRADTPERERRPFYLYADEFQNYASNGFAVILSEARKYALSLTLGHQYLGQLPENLRQAVLGNAGLLTLRTWSSKSHSCVRWRRRLRLFTARLTVCRLPKGANSQEQARLDAILAEKDLEEKRLRDLRAENDRNERALRDQREDAERIARERRKEEQLLAETRAFSGQRSACRKYDIAACETALRSPHATAQDAIDLQSWSGVALKFRTDLDGCRSTRVFSLQKQFVWRYRQR